MPNFHKSDIISTERVNGKLVIEYEQDTNFVIDTLPQIYVYHGRREVWQLEQANEFAVMRSNGREWIEREHVVESESERDLWNHDDLWTESVGQLRLRAEPTNVSTINMVHYWRGAIYISGRDGEVELFSDDHYQGEEAAQRGLKDKAAALLVAWLRELSPKETTTAAKVIE